MNTYLIKLLALLFALLAMRCPMYSQKMQQNDDLAEMHCFSHAQTVAELHEWIGFKVKTLHYRNNSLLSSDAKTCIIHYGEDFLVCIHDPEKDTYSCFTETDYKEINNKNRTIAIYQSFRKESAIDYLKYGIGGTLESFFDYLYYLYPTALGELQIVDEIFCGEDEIMTVGGRRIRFLLEKSAVGESFEEDTNIINSQYFINPVGSLLDSVRVSTQAGGNVIERFVSFHDFDFSDRQNFIDSLFDFEKPVYKGYSYEKQCE